MAGTLKLTDIAHSSGAGTITVDSLATLAVSTGKLLVGGTAITSGSSNILRKTADYTIVTGDVSGKSELVITASAAASTRTITLPAVAAVGMSTCIITIVADADATSTYKLMVQDSASAEVWTGYQKNDFVRLVVSNSVWVVLDHKETYYSYRYKAADQTIATSSTAKLLTWTLITEIGNTWDNTNNKITTPTGMNGYWTVQYNLASAASHGGVAPTLYLNGVNVWQNAHTFDTGGYRYGGLGHVGKYYATSTQDIEFYSTNARSDYSHTLAGGARNKTNFIVQFERVY